MCTVHGVRCVVCGVWCAVCGVWCAVCVCYLFTQAGIYGSYAADVCLWWMVLTSARFKPATCNPRGFVALHLNHLATEILINTTLNFSNLYFIHIIFTSMIENMMCAGLFHQFFTIFCWCCSDYCHTKIFCKHHRWQSNLKDNAYKVICKYCYSWNWIGRAEKY